MSFSRVSNDKKQDLDLHHFGGCSLWTVLHYNITTSASFVFQFKKSRTSKCYWHNMCSMSSHHIVYYLQRVSRVLQLQFYSSVHAGRLDQPSSLSSPENHIRRIWIQFDEIRSNLLIPEREIMMKHQWRLWENWEQLIKTSSLNPEISHFTAKSCFSQEKTLDLSHLGTQSYMNHTAYDPLHCQSEDTFIQVLSRVNKVLAADSGGHMSQTDRQLLSEPDEVSKNNFGWVSDHEAAHMRYQTACSWFQSFLQMLNLLTSVMGDLLLTLSRMLRTRAHTSSSACSFRSSALSWFPSADSTSFKILSCHSNRSTCFSRQTSSSPDVRLPANRPKSEWNV